MVRAVALFSGSMASVVAAKLAMEAPHVDDVRLLHFRSPFFKYFSETKQLARSLWLPDLHSQSVKSHFRELTNMNGSYQMRDCCMGCRSLMLKKGLRYMRRVNADFLVTGEIVGTRGMGSEDIRWVSEQVGDQSRIIRPLSARLLPKTMPQTEGWMGLRQLHSLTADQPEALIQLAKKLKVNAEDYPAERRCRLTTARFGHRLEDLLQEESFSMNSLELLEFQHYYKKSPDVKIVLGCDAEEKKQLHNFFLPSDIRLYIPVHNAPMALVRSNWDEKSNQEISQIVELAGRIAATHSKAHRSHRIPAHYRFESDEETMRIQVSPFESSKEIEQHCRRLG